MNREWLKQYTYYIVIGVVSLFALFFLPFIGSSIGLEWQFPNTVAGWVVYIVSKLIVSALNVLIFHCFIQQAKINIKDNENYKRANEILGRISNEKKEYKPRSPQEWNGKQYSRKTVTIFLSSITAAIGLTQAILTFDYVSMLVYFFTIVMGVIFGILQMKKNEIYWTSEYLDYALSLEQEEMIINEQTNEINKISETKEEQHSVQI